MENNNECVRCLNDINHPLGLTLDEDGVCSGCRIHEEKNIINWNERWERLENIVKQYKSRDQRNYDCVIPVSGAGDSFFTVYLAKEKLKLNPLLVTNNKYYNTALGIRNLAQLRIRFDCDILIQNVSPIAVKKIIRTTLRELKSFHWPALAGQSVFPVKTAISHKIPLIIWGAHQGLEQVGMFSHLHEVEMTRRYRKDHDLMGYEADDLLSTFDTLTEEDIWQYRYPTEDEIEKVGVRGIYLGNYVRWDPIAQHREMTKIANYHSSKMQRTFDIYDHVDDWHFMGIHDYIKQIKHGYSRVRDQVSREIRHGRVTKEKGREIVKHYQSQKVENHELLCDWLGITQESLYFILERKIKSVSKDITAKTSEKPFEGNNEELSLIPNDRMERKGNKKHIIIGKGYPD